ncbi:LysR substrate-binding domain-containing protein [Azospirillum picis]|uniref:DNA-binding transcriptional LysR family regulator n=1 Tax=Azospirillum picis TaxID=488438 RepID=A0ABU0MN11_9PROT|nr:LysR substrate-binding domain-containing protein [Azospirillum picis]MBP2303587.1 DNA-binding transcriptional LysR family regulator [Azospirillum picis]MDQ0534786.1 DNA-binding transcriptional LysR family regulator [Azospirillum picis]
MPMPAQPFPADWFLRARLKLRHMQLFLALDEHRNLHRAAASLNLSQPAASKLLGDLEDALGVMLFERHTRGVEPNWYGALMIRHARMILSELKEVGEELNALQAGHSGRVVVGTVSAPAVEFVTEAIDRVQRDHPRLRIGVEVENSDVLLDHVQHGRLDFALARPSKAQDPSIFEYEEVGEEALSFIVRDGHPLCGLGRPVALDDLLDARWALPPRGTLLRDRVDAMFRAAGLPEPRRVVESASPVFLMAMAARTESLTVLTSALGDIVRAPGTFTVLPFGTAFAVEPYGIVRLRERPLSPGAATLLDALRTAMRRAGADRGLIAGGS